MQSAIAAGHHGVPDSEEDVVCGLVEGRRGAPRQTYEQTSNNLHTVFYVRELRFRENS